MRCCLVLIPFFLLVSCKRPVKGANGVAFNFAVQYNDYIISRQNRLVRDIQEIGRFFREKTDSTMVFLEGYAAEADHLVEEIKGMPVFKGDSSFRDAAVSSFGFYRNLFRNEYRQVTDMRRQGIDTTVKGRLQIQAIIGRVVREEENHDKILHQAQEKFAKNNGIDLVDNELKGNKVP